MPSRLALTLTPAGARLTTSPRRQSHAFTLTLALALALALTLALTLALALAAVMSGAAVSWNTFFLKNLLPVTLGNIVGGAVFVASAFSYTYG